MEGHSTTKLSSTAARALHPLSPERVNNSRLASAASTATTFSAASKESDDFPNEQKADGQLKTPQSSPVRPTKRGGPFAEYAVLDKSKGFALPSSPSLPEFHALRSHVRTNSDVQGLVQRFEHLDVRDRDAESAAQRKKLEAQIKRAEIAREEAESDVARLREETRRLRKERDEGLERERKVGKRLEAVMVLPLPSSDLAIRCTDTKQEDFATFKESSASQTAVLEKELRKMRKEAFKSSSAAVKLQEELKATRATLRVTHSNLDMEKQKLQRKEQDRFEMEYKLVPLQEQVDKLAQQLSIAEEEREALKKSIKAEEVAQVAASGMIALPHSQEQEDQSPSPRRSPQKGPSSPWSDDKENMQIIPKKNAELKRMADELDSERIRRRNAEDMADFLRAECMFGCCACKRIRRSPHSGDAQTTNELADSFEEIRAGRAEAIDIAGHIDTSAPVTGADEADQVHDTPVLDEAIDRMEVEVERGVADEPIALEEVIETRADAILEQKLHDVEEFPPAMDVEQSMNLMTEDHVEEPNPPVTEVSGSHLAVKAKGEEIVSHGSRKSFGERFDTTEDPVEKGTTTITVPLRPETPPSHHHGTPFRQQPHVRTVTTKMTVPMHFTPVSKPTRDQSELSNFDAALPANSNDISGSAGAVVAADVLAPQPFDRAAALAAIEYRRGRARSFAAGLATPRKQMVEGVHERRDISAPTLGQKAGATASSAPVSQSAGTVRSRSVGRANRR